MSPNGFSPKKSTNEAIMQINDIYTVLEQNRITIDQTCPINHGTQLRLTCGVKINHYSTNKVLVQGKAEPVARIRGVLGLDAPSPRAAVTVTRAPTIEAAPASGNYVTTPAMIAAILDSIPAELRVPSRPRHPEWSDNPATPGLPF